MKLTKQQRHELYLEGYNTLKHGRGGGICYHINIEIPTLTDPTKFKNEFKGEYPELFALSPLDLPVYWYSSKYGGYLDPYNEYDKLNLRLTILEFCIHMSAETQADIKRHNKANYALGA